MAIYLHDFTFLAARIKALREIPTPGVPVRKWTALENVREYYGFFKSREDEFS